jgi:hypothetical protein
MNRPERHTIQLKNGHFWMETNYDPSTMLAITILWTSEVPS